MAKEEVGYWDKRNMRYYRDRETFVEIEDTFAEMFPMWVISPANPLFFLRKQKCYVVPMH